MWNWISQVDENSCIHYCGPVEKLAWTFIHQPLHKNRCHLQSLKTVNLVDFKEAVTGKPGPGQNQGSQYSDRRWTSRDHDQSHTLSILIDKTLAIRYVTDNSLACKYSQDRFSGSFSQTEFSHSRKVNITCDVSPTNQCAQNAIASMQPIATILGLKG